MGTAWGVEIQGTDVDMAAWKDDLKPPFEPHVLTLEELEERPFVLCSAEFDGVDRPTEVLEIGKILIGRLNAAFATLAKTRPLRATGVIVQFRDGGKPRKHYVLEIEPATIEIRGQTLRARLTDKDGHVVVPEPRPSKVQDWMSAARRSNPIADALSYLQRPTDWFELWKAYEALNDHGLAKESIPEPKRRLFTHTANAIYRHREGKYEVPDSPMGSREAVALVRTMLEAAVSEVQSETSKE